MKLCLVIKMVKILEKQKSKIGKFIGTEQVSFDKMFQIGLKSCIVYIHVEVG